MVVIVQQWTANTLASHVLQNVCFLPALLEFLVCISFQSIYCAIGGVGPLEDFRSLRFRNLPQKMVIDIDSLDKGKVEKGMTAIRTPDFASDLLRKISAYVAVCILHLGNERFVPPEKMFYQLQAQPIDTRIN